MDTVQRIAFVYSAQRFHVLQAELELFVDHLLQEVDTRLLIHLRGIIPHTTTAGEFDIRFSSCTRCSKTTGQVIYVSMDGKMADGECHNTLDDMIQEINPVMCPNMHTTVMLLLVMSVSTATAERSFSIKRRHGEN